MKNLLFLTIATAAFLFFAGCAEKKTTSPKPMHNEAGMGVGKCGMGMMGRCQVGKCGINLKHGGIKCGTGKCGSEKAARGE